MWKDSLVQADVIRLRQNIQDLLRRRVLETVQIVLEEELSEALGTGRYERSEARQGYRNGHETRRITTQMGTQELEVPRGRLVEVADLMEFEQTGEPVDPRGRRGYAERMIHGAVYEARPDVNAVIHHHAYAVLPFSLISTPLRPVVHKATVIGRHVPVWDIRDEFGDTDMLVRTMEMGRSLARTMERNTCLLIGGHGAVVVGETVQLAVKAAVYLQVNARVLLEALRLGEPRQFTDGEIELSAAMENSPLSAERAWEYFCLRAGVDPI